MVNRVPVVHLGHILAVDGLAHHVPDAAEGALADGHLHRGAGVDDLEAALKAVGGGHGDAADHVTGQLALNLENRVDVTHGGIDVDGQGVVDVRHTALEFDVHDGADDTDDMSDTGGLRGVHINEICH